MKRQLWLCAALCLAACDTPDRSAEDGVVGSDRAWQPIGGAHPFSEAWIDRNSVQKLGSDNTLRIAEFQIAQYYGNYRLKIRQDIALLLSCEDGAWLQLGTEDREDFDAEVISGLRQSGKLKTDGNKDVTALKDAACR
jgi:hypothetical protein|tara:strand:- start:312 stop:725 length:414 start_codon:yes stop_codon:yes gene_type:complete